MVCTGTNAGAAIVTNENNGVPLALYDLNVTLTGVSGKRSGNPRAAVIVTYSIGTPSAPVSTGATFPLVLPVYRNFYALLQGTVVSPLIELPLLINQAVGSLLINISVVNAHYTDSTNTSIDGDVYLGICNVSFAANNKKNNDGTLDFLRQSPPALACPGQLITGASVVSTSGAPSSGTQQSPLSAEQVSQLSNAASRADVIDLGMQNSAASSLVLAASVSMLALAVSVLV